MNPRIRRTALALCGAAWMVGACIPGASRQSRLVENLNHYADDFRWCRWSNATEFMVPSLRGPYIEAGRRRGPDFRVADLEMGGVRMNDDEDEATVTLNVSWYTLRETIIRNTVLEQEWSYLDGGWRLVRERHVDGEPL